MKKTLIVLLTIAIGYIAFFHSCQDEEIVQYQEVSINYDSIKQTVRINEVKPLKTKYDSLLSEYAIFRGSIEPDSIFSIDTLSMRDTLYKAVDTAQIVENCMQMAYKYFAENRYDKILKNDTSAFVRVKFNVHQNHANNLELEFRNRRATKVIKKYTIKKKLYSGFYLGATIGYSNQINYDQSMNQYRKREIGYGLAMAWQMKNGTMVSFNNDFVNQNYYLTIYKRINLFGR